MIKLTCVNPICGKDFLFDDEKNPNAQKVQCQYCKHLQEIPKQKTSFIEPTILKEPESKQEAKPLFEDTALKKEEDFGVKRITTPIEPGAPVVSRKNLNLNWIMFPLLMAAGVAAAIYFSWNKKRPLQETKQSIYHMPDYTFTMTVDSPAYANSAFNTYFSVKQPVDSNTLFTFILNEIYLAESNDGIASLEIQSDKPNKNYALNVKMTAFHSPDSSTRTDSMSRSIEIISPTKGGPSQGSKTKKTSNNKTTTTISLYKLLSASTWMGGQYGNIKIKFNGASNLETGFASYKNDVILEDGSTRNGTEIVPAKTKSSVIQCLIPVTGNFINGIFIMDWGFVSESSSPKVKIDVLAYFKDNKPPKIICSTGEIAPTGKLKTLQGSIMENRTIENILIKITKLVDRNKTSGIYISNIKLTKE